MTAEEEPEAAAERAGDGARGVPESVDDGELVAMDTDVPTWEDTFFDRVSDRLMFNYDLVKDERIRGETWELFGEMRIESQKQFLHRSINFANHHMAEYLFARRAPRVGAADLDRLVDLADDLADEWITKDETHQGTEFTFVLVVPEIPDDVRRTVESFKQRTLLKFGYYGHYEVNLAVVAPDREEVVASPNADVSRAFALWRDPGTPETDPPSGGLIARLAHALRR